MIHVAPLFLDDCAFIQIEVQLPKTNLLVIQCEQGYVMCGALDIRLLRERLASRNIVAARAIGVRTLDELLHGQVESCTQAAESLGITAGMPIREALLRMHRAAL
ncbi:YunC family protein [Alicyclobacillus kakegawensis]|uniref:YunC family protein n=1 Tax=Alicyclobacillus kakegawensis TaxID=392012 RepID=UPI0008365469|nr:DUF1805 domain-containing protein [Alicyclobacillus kakegawensis]